MEFVGWNIKIQTETNPSLIDECGKTTFLGWYKDKSSDDGTVSTVFQGSGRASLNFGTCGGTVQSRVRAFLNDELIATAFNKIDSSINFYYKSKDELRLVIEHPNDNMIINSFKILCEGMLPY